MVLTSSQVLSVVLLLTGAAAPRPPFNALEASVPRKAAEPAALEGMSVVRRHPQLKVPTFVWLSSTPGPLLAASSERSARLALSRAAPLFGLTPRDLESLEELAPGPADARRRSFRQRVEGVELFRQRLNVVLDARGEAIALTGHLSPLAPASLRLPSFSLSGAQAVARALEDRSGVAVDAATLREGDRGAGGYQKVVPLLHSSLGSTASPRPARTKRVLFELPDRLEPAWYVETFSERATSSVVSARDGRVLFRHDLTAQEAFSYRVWADTDAQGLPWDGPQGTGGTPTPSGKPDGHQHPLAPSNVVSHASAPFSRKDPWLSATATETVGNNVDAYADLFEPDGYGPEGAPAAPASGDFRARLTGPRAFLHAYDVGAAPEGAQQRQAAITQLFYTANFLHDWFYDAGFDEAAGNAQQDNFGRGGLGGDVLLAEAQDVSGRNNANMLTPADGESPRMQMFVFDPTGNVWVDVNSPAPLQGRLLVGEALYGPRAYDVTGRVVAGEPALGCGPLTNASAVRGKVALLERGECAFTEKTQHAQRAGAVGVLVANNEDGLGRLAGDLQTSIPTVMVQKADGARLRSAASPVEARLVRLASADRDGSLDTSVVAHEWGHYVSNRLVGDGNGLDTVVARGLGEGWSDFIALLLLARSEDARVFSNAQWAGAYPIGAWVGSGGVNDGYYFGIRRVPYSVDFKKNGLTFRHSVYGQPLPADVPAAFDTDGENNREVHNTGEVWATMLWECYVELLKDSGRLTFDEAQERMKRYLISALKITPASPSFVDARDALLLATYAEDPVDAELFGRAFARRGLGTGAVVPDRYGAGLVESYAWGTLFELESAVLDDSQAACDRDGRLDVGETAQLEVKLKNLAGAPLLSTTVTVRSDNPDVLLENGGVYVVPPIGAFATATFSTPVRLRPGTGFGRATFEVQVTDGRLAVPRVLSTSFVAALQADVSELGSATETFDLLPFVWSPSRWDRGGEGAPFGRVTEPHGGHVHADDPAELSDQYLVSPPLQVGPSGLSFSFRHRHRFEGVGSTAFDGARVELSEDEGASWFDLGPFMVVGYNGKLATPQTEGNPLKGAPAYVLVSAGYPELRSETVRLPELKDKTVRVRFRLAADKNGGAPGWDIDDVAFEGLVNAPFPSLVPQRTPCTHLAPVVDAGAPQKVRPGDPVTLSGTGSDPEGAPLTFAWRQLAGPSVALVGADTATASFKAPREAATLAFELTASDGALASTSPTQVEVTLDRPPHAQVEGDVDASPGETVRLSAAASTDPEGEPLTFAWRQTSGPATELVRADAAILEVELPKGLDAGDTLTYQVTVRDPGGQEAEAQVRVHVRAAGGGCTSAPGPSVFGLWVLAWGARRWARAARRKLEATPFR